MKQCIEIKDEDSKRFAYLDGEKLLRFCEKSDKDFSSLRIEYLTKVHKNIKQRLRKQDSEMFRDLSLVLEPSVCSVSSEAETLDSLEKVGLMYGEDKEVKIVHGDLQVEGMNEETKVVQKLLDRTNLTQQWPSMKGMLLGSYKNYSLQNLCKRVILMHPDLTEFVKLCKIALCFSITSVECERSFSTQNRLKNKYRASIKSENLDTLISITMSKQDISTFNPIKAVQLWLSKKKRRKARLCQVYKPRAKKVC